MLSVCADMRTYTYVLHSKPRPKMNLRSHDVRLPQAVFKDKRLITEKRKLTEKKKKAQKNMYTHHKKSYLLTRSRLHARNA